MQIKNIDGLTTADLMNEIDRGGKFVIYQYCISIVIMTFRQSSDVYFIRSGEGAVGKGIGYTLLSLILGWWGIPWGPIYTIGVLFTNFSGGKDVTNEILASIEASIAAERMASVPLVPPQAAVEE